MPPTCRPPLEPGRSNQPRQRTESSAQQRMIEIIISACKQKRLDGSSWAAAKANNRSGSMGCTCVALSACAARSIRYPTPD